MLRTLLSLFLTLSLVSATAQVNIWQDEPHHRAVTLTPLLAEGESNLAVVVCPGGSYFWHDMEVEGIGVAQWLQSLGISAFVLKYRVAGIPAFLFHHRLLSGNHLYPRPLDDLKQALRYVRQHAEEYHIDPNRVGAMGFSAGGHLVMSAAEMLGSAERPAFVCPIYPVVSLTADCTHKRSRRALLGERQKRREEMRQTWSLERHVPKDCPPVFLVNCVDDPVVDYRNSELLDSALTHQGVEHLYIQYKTGGHGFGASTTKGTAECHQWKKAFSDWISKLNLTKLTR